MNQTKRTWVIGERETETRLEWLETYELGVPEIDGDHRTMFEFVALINVLADKGEHGAALALLDRFLDYCAGHYSREESLLRRWGYPSVDTHAGYHDELSLRGQAIRQGFAEARDRAARDACCDELLALFLDDIVKYDLQLKSFLEEAGLTVKT